MHYVVEHKKHGAVIAMNWRPSYSWKRSDKAFKFDSEAAAKAFIAEHKLGASCRPVGKSK